MSNNDTPVILVIGGAGGIGSAVARRLAQSCRLVLAGRNAERLASVATETGAQPVVLDARDSAAVEGAFQSVLSSYGRMDGVVNCAGSVLLKPAHPITDQEFGDTLALNLTTAFNVVRAATRVMMRQPEGGSIVLCSSVAARRGLVNHDAIAAAKAGVEGLALAAAASHARYRVRVNCVAPGLTRTELTRSLTQNESVAKMSAALHPLGRIGEPSEVASAICWLLDREQGWVTGQVIGVEGGLGHIQARGWNLTCNRMETRRGCARRRPSTRWDCGGWRIGMACGRCTNSCSPGCCAVSRVPRRETVDSVHYR